MTDTIAQLTQDQHNRRKHNPRNIGMIVNALQEVGAARSIVIDEFDNILAGNGTIEAAQLAGIERLKIVEADGEEIVAVRRRGLTDEQKRKLAIYDNRTQELSDWDTEQLLQDISAGMDFKEFFTDEELSELIEAPLLKEIEIKIAPKEYLRVLISVPLDRALDAKEIIESLKQFDDIEIDYGGN